MVWSINWAWKNRKESKEFVDSNWLQYSLCNLAPTYIVPPECFCDHANHACSLVLCFECLILFPSQLSTIELPPRHSSFSEERRLVLLRGVISLIKLIKLCCGIFGCVFVFSSKGKSVSEGDLFVCCQAPTRPNMPFDSWLSKTPLGSRSV